MASLFALHCGPRVDPEGSGGAAGASSADGISGAAAFCPTADAQPCKDLPEAECRSMSYADEVTYGCAPAMGQKIDPDSGNMVGDYVYIGCRTCCNNERCGTIDVSCTRSFASRFVRSGTCTG